MVAKKPQLTSVKKLVVIFAILSFLGLLSGAGLYLFISSKLPTREDIHNIRLQIPMRVYTADKKLIAEFGEKRRIPVAYENIPKALVYAFVSAEDDRYFEHNGVDFLGLVRAVFQLVKTGEKSQGGSTITMQAARNFFLTRKKTYTRKISEIILALKMERVLSKEQILQLYLNKIYLGNRSYGIGAAAQAYYGKTLEQLTLPEVAMIAGLPKAPSRYNPVVNAERAKIRRDYVLGRMLELGFIDRKAYDWAVNAPVTAMKHGRVSEVNAPYVAEMVRAYMLEKYGSKAYTEGYSVYTTLSSELQGFAKRAVRKNLIDYDTRHGYRGVEASLAQQEMGALSEYTLPEESSAQQEQWLNAIRRYPVVGDLLPAVVIEVKEKEVIVLTRSGRRILIPWKGLSWARPYINELNVSPAPESAADILRKGDVIKVTLSTTGGGYWRLAQVPQVEGALVSVNPKNGAVLALVGGFDFSQNKFNHVTQARRQPGSNFKPFLYSAALEYGYTPATLINDAPVVFDDPALETVWRPENYSGQFFGPTRLRRALYTSRNLVSIRLLRALGIKRVLDYVERFGFRTNELPRNLSLALGSGAMSPLEVVRGYAVFANGGYLIEPFFLQRIENREGEILFEAEPEEVCTECDSSHGGVESISGESNMDNLFGVKNDFDKPQNIAPRTVADRNVYLMNSIMRDVIKKGTGRRARVLHRKDLAGKTGTTNDQKDAWFSGFNQNIVTTVWVGFDKARTMGKRETGSRAALPMWIEFMKNALKFYPEQPLVRPPGLATVRIDMRTGKRVRAGENRDFSMLEIFREENIPEYAVTSKIKEMPYETPESLF